MASLLLACGDEGDAVPRPESVAPAPSTIATPEASALTPSETCARDLAEQTPEAVRATLGELGYDTLFADVCVGQRAEQAGDPAICAELSVSTLREHCVARVAIAHEHPTDCPLSRTIPGRDPLCVALAARDRRLCAVAGVLDRAVCEAALGRAGACAHLPAGERQGCVARSCDLATRVHGDARRTPALETSLEVTAEGREPRALTSADRGARLEYRECVRVLSLGDPSRLTAPFARGAIVLELVLAADAPLEVTLTNLPTGVSSALTLSLDGTRSGHATGGTVSLTTLEPELGGAVEGSFHVTLAGAPSVVDGTFTTFVRDVDPRPSTCEAEPTAPSSE